MEKNLNNEELSLDAFAIQNEEPKRIKARLIRMLVLAVNRHKIEFSSLRYIYRETIKRTKLSVPRKAKKLYNLPTSEEIDRFFDAINDPQTKLIFTLMLNSGLRVSEISKIKVSHLNLKEQTIFITGKGNKDRIVPITNKLSNAILMFLSARNHTYLFESSLGLPFSTRRLEQIFKTIKTKANIDRSMTPHSFRHFFFSSLASQNVDASIRALLAGHSSLKMQQHYTHLSIAGSKNMIIDILEKMEHQKILK